MRHRTYSYAQGRWLSRDPIGLWGDGVGMGNGYAYVGGNAANLRDLRGLLTIVIGGAGEFGYQEAKSIRDDVRNRASGETVEAFRHDEMDQLREFLKTYNVKCGETLTIIGYSWGGHEAIKLAQSGIPPSGT